MLLQLETTNLLNMSVLFSSEKKLIPEVEKMIIMC